ncbi:MAG: metallophosphoesterase, partial [bacterium]
MDDRPVFFVGDIQGCARELELLLERAGFRPKAHRLIPVGDTINRGPDAPGVLDRLEQAGAEPILGNHERALIDILYSGYVPPWAESPRSAYAQLTAAERWEAEIRRIAQWPLWREGPDWIAVHAGHHPIRRPADVSPGGLPDRLRVDRLTVRIMLAGRPVSAAIYDRLKLVAGAGADGYEFALT